MGHRKKKHRILKRRSGGRTALIMLLVLLGLVLLVVGTVYGLFHYFYGKLNHTPVPAAPSPTPAYEVIAWPEVTAAVMTPSPEDSPQSKIDELEAQLRANLEAGAVPLDFDDENVYHILLIGSDQRADEISRSDSMIVVSINRDTKKIVLTSLMRDIYLTMPDYWNDRLNASYAYGGPELLMDTIESNFRIPVEQYVQVNFQSFIDVVDILGGVTVNVSEEENAVMRNGGWEVGADPLPADKVGDVTLNGGQASIYVRMRNVGASDFDRTARQREVIEALFEKAKGMKLSQLNDLANAVLPQIHTNLSQGEIFDILLHAIEYLGYDMQTCRIPVDGSYEGLMINGMSVLGIDFETNIQYWYETVYE